MVKNLPANVGDIRDSGFIPGSGRLPVGGRGNPLLYSCLGKLCGQRSLAGYGLYGHKESDTTKRLNNKNELLTSLERRLRNKT